MFTIRKEQMDQFRDERMGQSRARIMARLRQRLPDMVARYQPEELKQLCDRGFYKAAQYEIRIEANVYRFIAAMLFFGEDFDVNPELTWTKDVLPDPLMEEDHKSRLLELRIAIDKQRGI